MRHGMRDETTHRVVVTREGDAWLFAVEGVEGAFSESRDLWLLDRYAREVLALALDLPDTGDVRHQFDWVFDVPARDLVREFGPGWTVADVAAAMGVSVERVTHVAPTLATRLARWTTLVRLSWRYRRRWHSRREEGDDAALAAGARVA